MFFGVLYWLFIELDSLFSHFVSMCARYLCRTCHSAVMKLNKLHVFLEFCCLFRCSRYLKGYKCMLHNSCIITILQAITRKHESVSKTRKYKKRKSKVKLLHMKISRFMICSNCGLPRTSSMSLDCIWNQDLFRTARVTFVSGTGRVRILLAIQRRSQILYSSNISFIHILKYYLARVVNQLVD